MTLKKKVFFSKIKRSSLVIHIHRFILWLFTDLCVDIPFCLVIKLPELQVITTPFFEKQNSLHILVATESMTRHDASNFFARLLMKKIVQIYGTRHSGEFSTQVHVNVAMWHIYNSMEFSLI